MKKRLLKHIWLLLWLLFAGGTLPSIMWGYDVQPNCLSIGYDLCPASTTDYDSTPMHIRNERKTPGSAGCAVFGEFAKFLAAETGGGADIALGSRVGGLRTFASDIGADHLLDVPESEWQDVFLSHVEDPTTTFHVNMTGFYGDTTEEMILNEMQSGSNTGWELQQLQQAGRLPQVNFYQNGAGTLLANPFK